MAGPGLPPWPMNQERRTHTVDLRRSWVPSPIIPAMEAENGQPPSEEEPSSASTSTRSARSSGRKHRTRREPGDEPALSEERRGRRQSWLSCFRPTSLFSRRSRVVEDSDDDDAVKHLEGRRDTMHRREVAPAEWRAYGYWARPYINYPWAIRVNNATPLQDQRELSPPEVDAMLATIREPGGQTFPQNWVPRVTHPALPPRPDLWPTPPQTYSPLPGELQLNPWLTHRIVGTPPLYFDLRLRAADAQIHVRDELYRTGRRADLRVDGPNGSQPATYPGVPRLRVCALAGDAQPAFWWPFTVLPHHEALPVQVRDVLDALIANFEERVSLAEHNLLSDERAHMVHRAYTRRLALVVGGRRAPEDDGLRRVDYLGDNFCFRGLEPAPDGEGFMMFVGPPP